MILSLKYFQILNPSECYSVICQTQRYYNAQAIFNGAFLWWRCVKVGTILVDVSSMVNYSIIVLLQRCEYITYINM